jgi:hypothetical protein
MRSIVPVLTFIFLAFAGCQEQAQPDSGSPNQTTSQAIGAPDSAAPGGECVTAGDCRLFSDYCGGCGCRALPSEAPAPTCKGYLVACFVDPCGLKAAACENGYCVARNGDPTE